MAENDDEIMIDHPVTPTIRNCFRQIVEYCGPLEERGVAAYEGYDKIQVEDDNTLSERNRSVGGKEPRFFTREAPFSYEKLLLASTDWLVEGKKPGFWKTH